MEYDLFNDIKIVQACIEQMPILANLLELYAYDFTEHWKFDIGDNGFYGYEDLPLYWTDSNRYPYIIYVKNKIAGFIMIQRGSPISDDKEMWDIAEFFILKKYQNQGIGTAVVHQIWKKFKGCWQVRVLIENEDACAFWLQAITKFIGQTPNKTVKHIKRDDWSADWFIYKFKQE